MLNFLTFGQLDSQCLKQAGNLTDNDIYPVTRQNYINSKLMKLYAMLNAANDPFYNRSTVLTVAADQLNYNSADNAISIVAATNTLSVDAVNIPAGSIVAVSIYDTVGVAIVAQFIGRIITGGVNAVYEIISGSDSNSSTHFVSVQVIKSLSDLSVDVSAIYFKEFTAIYDDKYTSTPGEKNRLFDGVVDPKVFFNRALDFNAFKRVAWYQQGDTIHIFVGSSAIALGTVTGEYRGKPAIYTDATINDLIDLPPELNQALIDEVVASYLVEINKPIPQEIQSRLASYESKVFEAAEASKQKAMEKANK